MDILKGEELYSRLTPVEFAKEVAFKLAHNETILNVQKKQ
jgi:hypothetical protein